MQMEDVFYKHWPDKENVFHTKGNSKSIYDELKPEVKNIGEKKAQKGKVRLEVGWNLSEDEK